LIKRASSAQGMPEGVVRYVDFWIVFIGKEREI